MAKDDYESEVFGIGALIVREYNDEPSNFRSEETLEEVLDSIKAGYVSYVINTRAILSGKHFGDGAAIRRCAAQNNITMLTSLDTVRMLLDVLEEVTLAVSTIDEK